MNSQLRRECEWGTVKYPCKVLPTNYINTIYIVFILTYIHTFRGNVYYATIQADWYKLWCLWMKSYSVTGQMKATHCEHYFPAMMW